MVFSWENDPRTAGRVVEVSDHVALNHEKNRPGRNDKSVRYLVVLPETLSEKGLDIEIEDQLAKDSIEDYLDDGKIVEVRHYDGAAASVQSLLENIERQWYYTKVAPLRLEQTSAGGGFL
ncbi:hypothetical protein KA013_00435 [Patescibacteria group bacterium]|nr:hypothetical protein [Patescibacteria group bacterium]